LGWIFVATAGKPEKFLTLSFFLDVSKALTLHPARV
jgi:hypothetical protein